MIKVCNHSNFVLTSSSNLQSQCKKHNRQLIQPNSAVDEKRQLMIQPHIPPKKTLSKSGDHISFSSRTHRVPKLPASELKAMEKGRPWDPWAVEYVPQRSGKNVKGSASDTKYRNATVEEKFGEQNFRVLSEMRFLGKIMVAILDFCRACRNFSEIWREIGF